MKSRCEAWRTLWRTSFGNGSLKKNTEAIGFQEALPELKTPSFPAAPDVQNRFAKSAAGEAKGGQFQMGYPVGMLGDFPSEG